jgi:transcriptional regulator with XRE-family HTH domain
LVRENRVQAGISQGALGRRAGISGIHVGNLENGKTPDPRASTVAKLAHAFGVPAADLLQPFETVNP